MQFVRSCAAPMLRAHVAVVLLTGAFVTTASAGNLTFDDIQLWAGSGQSRAAVVVDWNDGLNPQSLAWGFRWDGVATGRQMLNAIVAADPRLAEFGIFNGAAVFGFGYDLDGDGGTFTPGTKGNETGFASDPDDHYREGWFDNGYWAYYVDDSGDTSAPEAGDWGFAPAGLNDRILQPNSWDGLSFWPAFSGDAPSAPVPAVPEPATAALVVLPMLLALRRR